ncbi:hypothetical protein BRARA_F00493 [Brassica rapa]|uniref:Uncharacterized protein n=1 Tax=Brassica campestris TaxID=3711 RepID=A0A397YWT2_BRACM|nr:hypothetical protein BRARA_F00493 [Brassica rapa]
MDNKDRCEYLGNSIEGATAYVEPISPLYSGDSGFIALSPLCDHYNDQMRIDSLTTCFDEEIIESLYQNLFSSALCLQIEEPGDAPMQLSRPSRNIDLGFQRKLS